MSDVNDVPSKTPLGVLPTEDEESDVGKSDRLEKATLEDRDDYIDSDTFSDKRSESPDPSRASNATHYTRQ